MKLTLLSILALVSAAAAQGPDPKSIYVEAIKHAGSGCPQGTMSTAMSSDRKLFTLMFDQYYASLGPNVGIEQNRKNCQINVGVRFPQGWQYGIVSSQYRGYAQLDRGVHGQHKSTYYFAGQSQQVSVTKDFYGPLVQDYLSNESVGVIAYSPCGFSANLNVNSQVRMFNEGGSSQSKGLLTADSQDHKFRHLFGFSWRRC